MNIYTPDEIALQQRAQQQQRNRFIMRNLAVEPRDRNQFAREVEAAIIDRLRETGRFVSRTSYHEHFDLLVDGLRIEVKAAALSGGRYQAALRSNDADVLILACDDGDRRTYFVIPFERVRGLTHIEIRNADPAAYRGWMAAWRDAWHVIDRYINAEIEDYEQATA